MSKPDLLEGIIRSPSAKIFLRMVTKGFYDNSYIGLWMYEVIGREWDEMRRWAEGLKDEINPQTCTWSIGIWEWVYGIETNESLPIEYRRQRILAKIIGVRPINPEIIRRGVAALIGGELDEVEVNDFVGPYRFEVILHPSGKSPFPYIKIFEYVREIKPSHLAFEAAVETKVDIKIEIDTSWNLVGFGLTGQYNCGTRPNINIKSQLRDLFIKVNAEGIATTIQSEVAGTLFASGNIENPQRMPTPSTKFSQTVVDVAAKIDSKEFTVIALPTAEERKTGKFPDTQIKARLSDTEILAEVSGKGIPFKADSTGTKPQTQVRFNQENASITANVDTRGYVFQLDLAGTKPQESVKAAHREVMISENVEIESYHVLYSPAKSENSEIGRYPDTQIKIGMGQVEIEPYISAKGFCVSDLVKAGTKPQAEKTLNEKGAIMPTIETSSYTISFRMCGTDVTRES